PGAEAEGVLEEIAECVRELRCADTGRPLVARLARYEELYDAEPGSGPADLFIQWARVPRARAVRSDRLGEIPVPALRSIRSVHRVPGFVVGAGPGIEPSGGRRLRGEDHGVVGVQTGAESCGLLRWKPVQSLLEPR